jgi:hypothetical protein
MPVTAEEVRGVFARLEEQEQDKKEMYHQVGKAIVNLSIIEEFMADLFVTLSRPMTQTKAADMFYESQNLNHKIKLVDYAMMRSEFEYGKKYWPALSAQISKQKFVRNTAAHASIGYTQQKRGERWRISLTTQELNKKHRAQVLEIDDMKVAANELNDMRSQMHKMLIQALRHIGPETED